MSFKERNNVDAEVTTALGGTDRRTGKKNPSQVEGYYLGFKETASAKSKTGTSKLHILQTPKGNLGVWGKTDLDRKLTGVKAGTMVRLTHTGMQATKNGEMYKYKVEVDEDNTIEVDASENQPIDSAHSGYEEPESFSETDEDEPALDEVPYTPAARPAKAAATPSAANQAKVQALLAGNRSKS
jgi:hypothetical protein